MNKRIGNYQIANERETMPRISLIIEYELKMKDKKGLFNILKAKADEVEKELLRDYSEERVTRVIKKLRKVVNKVKCPPNGKNMGIFVSPVAEKVYYFTPSHLEKYRLPH